MSRHVRVTLEGATEQSGGVLRLRVGANHPAAGAFPLMVVDSNWPGVSVEDVTPERVWTDGDVVQCVRSDRVFARGEWEWPATADTAVDSGVEDGTYRVLRYQHGDPS